MMQQLLPYMLSMARCYLCHNLAALGPSATHLIGGGGGWKAPRRSLPLAAVRRLLAGAASAVLRKRYIMKPMATKCTTTRIATSAPAPCSACGECWCSTRWKPLCSSCLCSWLVLCSRNAIIFPGHAMLCSHLLPPAVRASLSQTLSTADASDGLQAD